MRKLYADRDVVALGQFYADHCMAMTAEGLHEKSEIAAELAWRDQRIVELASLLQEVRPTLDDWDEMPVDTKWVNSIKQLAARIDRALD